MGLLGGHRSGGPFDPSFERFVKEHSTALLRVAYLFTDDRDHAEDLLQTTLLRTAWRWSVARRRPEAYARRVLINLSRDHYQQLRRRVAEDPVADLGAVAGVGDPAGHTVDREALSRALQRLPIRQRQTVVLRFFADLSVAETASVLRCSQGTVKSYTNRALARLRKALEESAPKVQRATDQQIADELRVLLRSHAAGLEPAEDLLAELEGRHVWRVQRAQLTVGTACALVGLAVTVLATIVGSGMAGRPPAQPASSTVTTPSTSVPNSSPLGAEQLLQRARGAVVGEENLVVHVECQTRTVYGVMRLDLEGWGLESTGQARVLSYYAEDSPQADTVHTRQPDGSTITESLDLAGRTVATTGTPGRPPNPVLTLISFPIGDPRDLLTGINYTTDGRSSDLGGRQVYRLLGPEGSQLQVWLDAQTYRLVRVQTGNKYDITYQWLPANEENLALLEHEVPADFARR